MSIYNDVLSIYIVYIPNINLTRFEPLKPSRSGGISLFSILILKEAVEQPYCLAKNMIFIHKILILPVYVLITPVTQMLFKIIKVVLKKLAKIGGYVVPVMWKKREIFYTNILTDTK